MTWHAEHNVEFPEELTRLEPEARVIAAIAAESIVEWRLNARSAALFEAGKRTSDSCRPKGTGKSYWAWIARREALCEFDAEYRRLLVLMGYWRMRTSPLVSPYLFRLDKATLANRWMAIRAEARRISASAIARYTRTAA